MVQLTPHRLRKNGSNPEAVYRSIIRDASSLPTTMLPDLVRDLLNMITAQVAVITADNRSENVPAGANQKQLASNLPADIGNFFDRLLAMSTRKEEMSTEEISQLREAALDAWLQLPAPENAPSDEEVKQIRHKRRVEKYG